MTIMCRHLQNAEDEKVRKRWQSCQLALEEESQAVRDKERRKTSSLTPYKKIIAKLFDSEPEAPELAALEVSSGQSHHNNKTLSRTPKMSQNPESNHSRRVMEVVSFASPEWR